MSLHDWMDQLARIMRLPAWTPDVQARARELYTRGFGINWAARILLLNIAVGD